MAESQINEIQFPFRVVFKGENNLYLKVWSAPESSNSDDALAFLKFNGEECDEESIFEIIPDADGFVAIKLFYSAKYWNSNPCAPVRPTQDGTKATVSPSAQPDNSDPRIADLGLITVYSSIIDQRALFKPVILEDKRIAFLLKDTNKYCQLYSVGTWDRVLSAEADQIDNSCKLTVGEPVSKRTVTKVVFDLSKMNMVSRTPSILGEQIITNETDHIETRTFDYNHTYNTTYSFNRSVSFTTDVKTTIEAGLPFVKKVDKKEETKVSETVTRTLKLGEDGIEPGTDLVTISVKDIKPKKSVKVIFRCKKIVFTVPYTYQQTDILFDGTEQTKNLSDGMFLATSEYFKRYETVNL